jgi:hypothetical protein
MSSIDRKERNRVHSRSQNRLLGVICASLYVMFIFSANVRLHAEDHKRISTDSHIHSLTCLFTSQFEVQIPIPGHSGTQSALPDHVEQLIAFLFLLADPKKLDDVAYSLYSISSLKNLQNLFLPFNRISILSARGPPN